MGNFDKAFKSKQRLHRERVNVLPKGFLERKKDYKVRAKEYNRRQSTITKLRKKTLDKNPDEFYFHMKKSHLVDGVHYEIRNDDKEFSPEELKMMVSQDLNYIKYKRSIDMNKIERIKGELHLLDNNEGMRNNHTFFVENDKEKKRFNFAKKMKVDSELLDMGYNIANPSAIKNISIEDIKTSAKVKALKYRRLENKIKREEFLRTLSDKMEMKKMKIKNKHKKN